MALVEADLRLYTTRIEGRLSHLGFSDMCLGRLDGINQQGLCVMHSNSWDPVPGDWQEPQGLLFAIAIRTALDQCSNVDEALDLLQSMPLGSNCTFFVADPSGKAARIEIAGKKRAILRIPPNIDIPYLVSANHFTLLTLPGAGTYIPGSHSTRRYDLVASWLQETRGRISTDSFKAFLDRDWSTGVSSYSVEHMAGTLWSMVFDATLRKVEIRFGPPPDNKWRTFKLDGAIGVYEYSVYLPGG